MVWSIHHYAHDNELVIDLAKSIVGALREAIEKRGVASIAVSGGSTPIGLFQALSQSELAWSKVVITLVDERWVPETDKDSNANLVRQYFLQDRAADARFVGLKTDHNAPALATFDLEATLYLKVLPLDVVVLGMGEDGHTASFFPQSDGLKEALESKDRICCGVQPVRAPHARMTLSLATVLSAAKVFLHFTGAKKKAVLDNAMLSGPVYELPVRAVLHQTAVPIEIYYADQK